MLSESDILILIPAFNEQASVGEVVKGARVYLKQARILVVDDGSSDATSRIARESGACVVRHPFNLGVGTALQTGYKYAVQNGFRYVIQLDADGQHSPSFLPRFVEKLKETEADLIIGSRFLAGNTTRLPFARRVGNALFGWIVTVLIGEKLSDPTSGFRALKSTVLQYCIGDTYGFDYPDADFLLTIHKLGFRIEEIPIDVLERRNGESQHHGLKPVYYIIKMFLSIFITLIRPKSRHKN